jgi:hypothetical protein
LVSASRPRRPDWRLKKTLGRAVDFRPIEAEDMRWIFAAYKQGALAGMGADFAKSDKDPAAFKTAFEAHVTSTYDGGWTLFANTSRGFSPIGLVFGVWAPLMPHIMVVAGIAFFPWARRRNVIEATVGFFSGIRRTLHFIGYALPEHKRLYEVCCAHGIMRRTGTSFIVFSDKPAAVFETRI